MAENIIETVDLPADVAPGAMGLLQLSDIFQRAGHVELAAYLRRCGDVVAVASAHPVAMMEWCGSGTLDGQIATVPGMKFIFDFPKLGSPVLQVGTRYLLVPQPEAKA